MIEAITKGIYRIYKFEFDGEYYISCGRLPYKYLSKEQAELKIKTLDTSFYYKIELDY